MWVLDAFVLAKLSRLLLGRFGLDRLADKEVADLLVQLFRRGIGLGMVLGIAVDEARDGRARLAVDGVEEV